MRDPDLDTTTNEAELAKIEKAKADFEEKQVFAAKERLRQIRNWSEVADNFTQAEKAEVTRLHKEKLARYRNRKDWEAWVEEDELDIEADRMLAEIKNYKSEYFFSSSFYNNWELSLIELWWLNLKIGLKKLKISKTTFDNQYV